MDKEYKMIYSIPKLISLTPPLSEGKEACVEGNGGGQGTCAFGNGANPCTQGGAASGGACVPGTAVGPS